MTTLKTQAQLDEEQRMIAASLHTTYPTHKKLDIYARQSNAKQVVKNKESAALQTVKLREKALEYGWLEQDTTVYVENKYNKFGVLSEAIRSASGSLSIDERPGLKIITQRIETGEIGAVMVYAVDRLFRDEDMIMPPSFAKLCKDYNVLVITYSNGIFDFNNPRENALKRFLNLAQAAADYNTAHVKNRMLVGRLEKAMRGEFSGHSVPTGLMLDDAREHYLINPVWAIVVQSLFKRFRALDADFTALRHEIVGKAIFPELPEDIKARIGQIHLTPVHGGYTIKSIVGLRGILTNVAYIGHAAYNGRIVKYNAHPTLVSEDDFLFAFNALSDVTLDGMPIEREKRVVRYRKEGETRREALLEGTRVDGRAVITSPDKSVYVFQQTKTERDAAYVVQDTINSPMDARHVASIHVSTLDKLVVERLFSRLQAFVPVFQHPETIARFQHSIMLRNTFQDAVVSEKQGPIATNTENIVEELKRAIARLDREYTVNFDLMTDKELRKNREDKIRFVKQVADIEHKQAKDAKEKAELQKALTSLRTGNIVAQWEKWDIEEKRKFLRLITEAFVLEPLAEGWLKLSIVWSRHLDYTFVDEIFIWQQSAARSWTDEEKDCVRELYPHAVRSILLETLPTRTWRAIITVASRLGIQRHMQWNDTNLPDCISVEDKRIMDENNLVITWSKQRVWKREIAIENCVGLS